METDLANSLYPLSVANDNWILKSKPRLRQVRIQPGNCPDKEIANAVKTNKVCNLDFSQADLENREFMSNWTTPGSSKNTPWTFLAEEELNGTTFYGFFDSYPHSGYSTTLGSRKDELLTQVKELRDAGWIDVRTRGLFIEFVMQNININRYTINTIAFEFASTGLVVQKFNMMYLRVHMYTSRIDHFRLFCEVMFGLLTFYLLWLIQDKLRRRGRRFFDKFWNIHLLVTFTANAVVVGLCIWRLIRFLELRPFLKNGVPQGYDLTYEAIIDWSIQACFGFVCFLLISKVGAK